MPAIALSFVLLSSHAGLAQQLSGLPQRGAIASAQQPNVPPAAQRAQRDAEDTARRFRMGIQGGVGLDPEIIDVGAHVTFGPVFKPNIDFRPGAELGFGEVTTLFAINLDVLYTFADVTRDSGWVPYAGGGPSFGLSHRGFETDEIDHITGVTDRGRFDFGDTDFDTGANFIVGMKRNRAFFEMKATAWGAANIRLLAGITF